MNRDLLLGEVDELLREWAFFYRDRRRLEHCRSIEHRFRATSEDFGPDGWGDMDAAPKKRSGRSYSALRAERTQDAIQCLERVYRWALTYGYCYSSMPRFVVLRCMKKYTGRRLNWQGYLDVLDIARMRLHTTISCANLLTAGNF